jgi:hypothetical protein
MFKGAHDIVFAFVIIIFSNDWLGKHNTIGLFETIKIITQALKKNSVELLDQYKLRKKIIAYVKDE